MKFEGKIRKLHGRITNFDFINIHNLVTRIVGAANARAVAQDSGQGLPATLRVQVSHEAVYCDISGLENPQRLYRELTKLGYGVDINSKLTKETK